MIMLMLMMMMMMVMMIIYRRGGLHASPTSSSPEYSHILICIQENRLIRVEDAKEKPTMAWSSLIVAVPAKQRRSEHLSHLPPESSTVRPAALLQPCCSLGGRSARRAGAAVALLTPPVPTIISYFCALCSRMSVLVQ